MTKPSTICLVSLGCPKNQVDSEVLLGGLLGAGVLHIEDALLADAVLINTCGFVKDAKEEAIEVILRHCAIKAERPDFIIAVAGCLVQRYGNELQGSFPEVDIWISGTSAEAVAPLLVKMHVRKRVKPSLWRPQLLNASGTAYLKVSEGCNNCCNYCAIPLIKGGLRSRTIEDVRQEARQLVKAHNVKELVLVSQDLTSFGRDRGMVDGLTTLLRSLLELDLPWIRIMYIYPLRLSSSTIKLMMSEPRICRYLDVPIQHADPAVLRRMGRKGSPSAVAKWLEELRESLPGLVLRSTVLVGHPGETPKAFRHLCAFIRRVGFEWLGAFSYSPEEGTSSALASRGKVEPRRARARAKTIDRLFLETRRMDAFGIGSQKMALVEAVENGVVICRSQSEAPEIDGVILAALPKERSVAVGDMISIRLLRAEGLDFMAEFV